MWLTVWSLLLAFGSVYSQVEICSSYISIVTFTEYTTVYASVNETVFDTRTDNGLLMGRATTTLTFSLLSTTTTSDLGRPSTTSTTTSATEPTQLSALGFEDVPKSQLYPFENAVSPDGWTLGDGVYFLDNSQGGDLTTPYGNRFVLAVASPGESVSFYRMIADRRRAVDEDPTESSYAYKVLSDDGFPSGCAVRVKFDEDEIDALAIDESDIPEEEWTIRQFFDTRSRMNGMLMIVLDCSDASVNNQDSKAMRVAFDAIGLPAFDAAAPPSTSSPLTTTSFLESPTTTTTTTTPITTTPLARSTTLSSASSESTTETSSELATLTTENTSSTTDSTTSTTTTTSGTTSTAETTISTTTQLESSTISVSPTSDTTTATSDSTSISAAESSTTRTFDISTSTTAISTSATMSFTSTSSTIRDVTTSTTMTAKTTDTSSMADSTPTTTTIQATATSASTTTIATTTTHDSTSETSTTTSETSTTTSETSTTTSETSTTTSETTTTATTTDTTTTSTTTQNSVCATATGFIRNAGFETGEDISPWRQSRPDTNVDEENYYNNYRSNVYPGLSPCGSYSIYFLLFNNYAYTPSDDPVNRGGISQSLSGVPKQVDLKLSMAYREYGGESATCVMRIEYAGDLVYEIPINAIYGEWTRTSKTFQTTQSDGDLLISVMCIPTTTQDKYSSVNSIALFIDDVALEAVTDSAGSASTTTVDTTTTTTTTTELTTSTTTETTTTSTTTTDETTTTTTTTTKSVNPVCATATGFIQNAGFENGFDNSPWKGDPEGFPKVVGYRYPVCGSYTGYYLMSKFVYQGREVTRPIVSIRQALSNLPTGIDLKFSMAYRNFEDYDGLDSCVTRISFAGDLISEYNIDTNVHDWLRISQQFQTTQSDGDLLILTTCEGSSGQAQGDGSYYGEALLFVDDIALEVV